VDLAILHALNDLSGSPLIAAVAMAFSSIWVLVVVGLSILARALYQRRYVALVVIPLTVGVGDRLGAGLVKPAVGRVRPCRAPDLPLQQPVPCGVGQSFPSNHSLNAFAFAVVAMPEVSLLILGPLAALVAISRVVLGVHYPSDVLGGTLIGIAVGALGLFLRRRLERRFQKDQVTSPSP
jgi:undecaprenyl-diphosphatase